MTTQLAETFFSTWKLDRSNGVLLHVQIERFLHEMITRPPHSSGALLPDELTMANRLRVSRGTVRESKKGDAAPAPASDLVRRSRPSD